MYVVNQFLSLARISYSPNITQTCWILLTISILSKKSYQSRIRF